MVRADGNSGDRHAPNDTEVVPQLVVVFGETTEDQAHLPDLLVMRSTMIASTKPRAVGKAIERRRNLVTWRLP
jgi:hypothetical protein